MYCQASVSRGGFNYIFAERPGLCPISPAAIHLFERNDAKSSQRLNYLESMCSSFLTLGVRPQLNAMCGTRLGCRGIGLICVYQT
jgi:hypothetical protein